MGIMPSNWQKIQHLMITCMEKDEVQSFTAASGQQIGISLKIVPSVSR